MANVAISALPAATTVAAADLVPLVQGGVTKQASADKLPVSTAAATALAGKANTAHTHPAADITDATTTGRAVLTAADAAAARTAIGAGTSSLAIGTTSGTAADAATTTTALAAKAPLTGVEGIKVHDGTAGGGTRPTGYARIKWVGGTTRPTNMVTGDVWERDA